MIYTDGIQLIGTNLVELHYFAETIGLHRRCFHDKRYDLLGARFRRIAILKGAKLISSKEIVKILEEYGNGA